jgi:alpha-amylase
VTFAATRRLPAGLARLALLVALIAACQPAAVTTGTTARPSVLAAASAGVVGTPPACPPGPSAAPVTGVPAGRGPATTGPGWWRDRVFYEVFVRSFADSDGDGVGDLRGLISRLDYLNDGDPETATDLGVTGLWLMPTFPSPSYHGYDVTDLRGVNPDYGSLEDMRALVAAAHRRGIAVVLDLPINHTSDQHPWFVDSKKPGSAHADWYVWSDKQGAGNWHRVGSRLYYGAFGAEFPDLNLTEPKVTAALDDIARFWVADVGVDGFRIDAAKHLIEDPTATENTPETRLWLRAFRSSVEKTAPGALLIGEVWDPSPVSSAYVPDALDMTFEFGLSTAYIGAVRTGQAQSLDGSLTKITSLYPPAGGFGAFLSNHDMDRVASQMAGDQDELRLAASLLLTGPGVPFVYYGEEIGMTGAKPDERIRTPMRWDAGEPAAGFSTHAPWEAMSPDDPATTNVAAEAADPGSLWSTYRDLVALRARHTAISSGTYLPVTSDAPAVVAAIRSSAGETALVITNVSDAPAAPTLSLASGPLCGTPKGTIVLGADEGAATAPGPNVTPAGGFAGYRPVAEILPRSVVIIVLTP